MITGEPCTYWVCVDCFHAHHGCGEDWTGDTVHPHPDAAFYVAPYTPPAPLSRIPAAAEVTSGLLLAEHSEDCPNRGAGEWIGAECECERVTFTRSACDGCGSELAGEREALTVWVGPNDSAVTLTYPGMDDCDAATLVGIIADALSTHPRARDMLAGREVTATCRAVYAGADYVSVLAIPGGAS